MSLHSCFVFRHDSTLPSVEAGPPETIAPWSMSVHIPVRDRIPLFDPDECTEPLSEWQDANYPNCNAFHSVDMTNDKEMKLLGLGGHRMVWNHKNQAVLKVMRWKDSFFEPRQNEHVRIDAMVSERLTSSPHVMNVYGVCGLSMLNEMGRPERHCQKRLKPENRLHIARQLAHAVADLHDVDGTNVTTAVWRNLKPENVLFVGDKLKINDFDDSILVRRNSKDGSACKFQLPSARYQDRVFQPPELCYSGRDLDETIDIYSLGSILYQILTGKSPYFEFRNNRGEIEKRKRAGILPEIPVSPNDDAGIVALQRVVKECMSLDPSKRPTARQVANDLDRAHNDIANRYR